MWYWRNCTEFVCAKGLYTTELAFWNCVIVSNYVPGYSGACEAWRTSSTVRSFAFLIFFCCLLCFVGAIDNFPGVTLLKRQRFFFLFTVFFYIIKFGALCKCVRVTCVRVPVYIYMCTTSRSDRFGGFAHVLCLNLFDTPPILVGA